MSACLWIGLMAVISAADAGELGREGAVGALTSAKNAIAQSPKGKARDEAEQKLKQAQSLFDGQQYAEAARAADGAWQAANAPAEATRFAVEVSETGATRVTSKSGRPVRVEAQGVTRPVSSGQTVEVSRGETPKLAPVALGVPAPSAPASNALLKFSAANTQLGPVNLVWGPVPSALSYEVEIAPVEGATEKTITLKASVASASVKHLEAGKYGWTVRAIGPEGERGEPSAPQRFEVVRDAVRLEVQGTKWK